jgi:integrase
MAQVRIGEPAPQSDTAPVRRQAWAATAPPLSEGQPRPLDPARAEEGCRLPLLRHTTATLLARAKVLPSAAQKILRHANIETTLAI